MSTSSPGPSRRQILALMGGFSGLGILTIAGCAGDSSPASSNDERRSRTPTTTSSLTSTTTAGAGAAMAASCVDVPEETAGPYPGDGSNGPNVLSQDGVVRRDIRSSLGTAGGTVGGAPLTVSLTVLDLKNGCKPLVGAAIYAWHCDADGRYSMYSQGATGETWLRGVQPTDSSGTATFQTIFPGAYPGRWPHVHFEVYPNVAAATNASGKLATSQIALPEDACRQAYTTSGYATSARNFPQTPLASDGVFRDGWSQQLSTVTATPSNGLVSTLTIAV